MASMLKSSLEQYPSAFAASFVLVAVTVMFSMIGIWIFSRKSKPMFERASRLPLDMTSDEEN